LASEEVKQEITNFDNSRVASTMGRDWRDRRPRHSDSEDPTPGAFAFSNEQANLVRQVKGSITASMVEEGQTSSLSLMENEGPTSPSAIDEQALVLGELAEPSQEDKELRRRYQEVVTGTAVVQNRVSVFEPFGRKERKFLIGAALPYF
jgi:hypothetical protein